MMPFYPDSETFAPPPAPPWEALTALVQGVSVIDLASMPIYTEHDAYQFVMAYGYDVHQPNDAEALRMLTRLALQFIQNTLIPNEEGGAKLALPAAFTQAQPPDVVQLILLASQPVRSQEAQWACAVLKVLHTLVHIDNTPKLHYVRLAKEQILKAYHSVLSYDAKTGRYVLHSRDKQRQVPLAGVDIKELKSRDSLLIKLLSKKANMVEDIDDLIGLRFITHRSEDCLLALTILLEERLIVFSNTKPSRSRNSLIAEQDFKTLWERSQHTASTDEGRTHIHTWAALEGRMTALREAQVTPKHESEAGQPKSFSDHNPHSADAYRGLHITTRHLLRIRQAGSPRDERVFFPYEIQFVDEASFRQNQEGDAHHSQYKKRQLAKTRHRVLGELLQRQKD